MFEGYRVIVVCPAGRRRVADIMRRYVERERPLVDRLHWWLNTDDPDDLDYFRGLSRAAPDFHRAIPPAGPVPRFGGFRRRHMLIGGFFVHAVDPATIYVRADDDVVWMDEGCLRALVAHRVTYPEPYLVYGNIVNSSRFMHLHQRAGAFDPGFPISYEISHATNRGSATAALHAHVALLDDAEALADGGDREAVLGPWTSIGRHRFGPGEHNDCNLVAWFGRDFARWKGFCPPHVHEEQWICLRMPAQYGGRTHEACGTALCSHYASVHQWAALDARPQVLERYRRLAPHSEVAPAAARSPAAAVAVS